VKVIVAGSRSITCAAFVDRAIRQSGFEITEVVCGMAMGVDLLGKDWADEHHIPVKEMPADWRPDEKYDRGAGFRRNERMVEYAEALIAIWDGESHGTKHMIELALEKGFQVYVYRVPVFVFGSNLKGIHGAGAARTARIKYGAQMGIGEGRTGQSYAIPTKASPYQRRNISKIHVSVKNFLRYAEDHAELDFVITRIGCGLAGYTDEDIAPLFADAPPNCQFDPLWKRFGLRSWEVAL